MNTPILTLTKRDFTVQTFRCGGHGGQNVNKVESGVRIIHEPSGVRVESCETRDQYRNKRLAFNRLVAHPQFQKWLRTETAKRLGQRVPETPEQILQRVNAQFDDDLRNGNILIEYINTQ